jgi:hypothetical protein
MAETVTNVTTGKPATGGAAYYAPVGTTLPTDVSTTLDTAFVSTGYISEDGLVNTNAPDTDTVTAWGGDTVLTLTTAKEDTFKFTLIETLNPDVLAAVYGTDNVSGTLATGITVNANSDSEESLSWVFDMIMRDGALKRIVVPNASITDIGDIEYKDDGATGYEITISASPDDSGNTHYEYIMAATTTSDTTTTTTSA